MKEKMHLEEEAYRQARIIRRNLNLLKKGELEIRYKSEEMRTNRFLLYSIFTTVILISLLISSLILLNGRDCISLNGECLNLGLLSLFVSFLAFISSIITFVLYNSKKEISNNRRFITTFIQRGEILLNQADYFNKNEEYNG